MIGIAMDAPKDRERAEEVEALETALAALNVAIDRLREADETVAGLLDQARETVGMPNSRRADQQIRTAMNAAVGARKSLQRRLELRRLALQRSAPRRAARRGERGK
jgi:hypothetical protein